MGAVQNGPVMNRTYHIEPQVSHMSDPGGSKPLIPGTLN